MQYLKKDCWGQVLNRAKCVIARLDPKAQRGLIPIVMSVFLLAAFIILSVTTVAVAQWAKPVSPPPTLEEDRLMNNYPNRDRIADYYKDLQGYKRDGCKEYFPGLWRYDKKGDIIEIKYNEKSGLFEGTVKTPLGLDYKKGHLLFRVDYFLDKNEGIQLPGSKVVSPGRPLQIVPPAESMDINWLRQQRQCRVARFKGKEYSFVKNTNKATTTDLLLILYDDKLEYKIEKQSATFTRLQ